MRVWRNWQTRGVERAESFAQWRFKSSHPHQICGSGETGKRGRFKTCCLRTSVSSNLTSRTSFKNNELKCGSGGIGRRNRLRICRLRRRASSNLAFRTNLFTRQLSLNRLLQPVSRNAGVAQRPERGRAMSEAASSNLATRSNFSCACSQVG